MKVSERGEGKTYIFLTVYLLETGGLIFVF